MGDDRQTAWRRYFLQERREDVQALATAYPRERTLAVDAIDLHSFDTALAEALFTTPDTTLAAAERALQDLYDGFTRVRIRPENYPGLSSVRSLRTEQRSELVGVEGIVLTTHPIRSKVAMAAFECSACGHRAARRPRGLEVRPPTRCSACETVGTVSFDDRTSTFVDVRRIELGDPEADAPNERDRWSVDVCLADDLVDRVTVRDPLMVTGILRVDGEPPLNRFDFVIEALDVDTEVAVAPTSALSPESSSDSGDSVAQTGQADVKSVLDTHWRQAVSEEDDRDHAPATTSQV